MGKLHGKLLVGQSGGCTPVLNASLQGVVEEARRHAKITAIWGARHGIEGLLRGEILNLRAESWARWTRIGRTPAAALGSCRRKISGSEAARLALFLRKNDVLYFLYIGGNDSADTAHLLAMAARRAHCELRVVLVPKTIDNDLPFTDHSPGFGSVARFLASAVADVGMETEAMRTVEPVRIIEVMGRNAGWLAAASALAKRTEADAPQFVWPPEAPFSERRFLGLVRGWLERIGYCVVVVAETVRARNDKPIAMKGRAETDSFGHPRLVGAGEYLCGLVQERLRVRARWDKPGSIQRMSSAHLSEVDLREARACGAQAVRFALKGASDCMVALRRKPGARYAVVFRTVPLAKIANAEKALPDGYFDRGAMLPTPEFRRYALPLVGPGLPEHARLAAAPQHLDGCARRPGTPNSQPLPA